MNRPPLFSTLAGLLLAISPALAASPDSQMSAKELAGRLATAQEGTSLVRLTMQAKGAVQLQLKQRRTGGETDVLYQVLWPKERKGEAVLLHKSAGSAASGWLLAPPNKPRPLGTGQMSEPLLGSDLAYEDAVENFFAWDNQTLAGSETVDRVNCLILDSKPGGGSIYGRVRSWVDPKRLVPMRVEKYLSSGRLARRIETTRVANDDKGRPIPANLTVHHGDSSTQLDGSRIRHDVNIPARDFTPEGMADLTPPKAGG